jgi:hypothetical protein
MLRLPARITEGPDGLPIDEPRFPSPASEGEPYSNGFRWWILRSGQWREVRREEFQRQIPRHVHNQLSFRSL